jgi:hypothetical protein
LTGSHAANPSLLPHVVFKVAPNAQPNVAESSSDLKQHRTITGFHGTSFENLHSIIRSGLVPASGTKLERNGKTFGEGVYLSTELPVAFAFCSSSGAERWKGSSLAPEGTKLRCILVCGVKEDAQKDEGELVSKKNGDPPPEHYLVIDRPDLITLQYILVYVDHCTRSSSRNVVAATGQDRDSGGVGWFLTVVVVLIAFVFWLMLSNSSPSSSRRRFVY